MIQLNFLPESYLRTRARRRMRRIEIAVVLIGCAAFAGGWAQLWSQRQMLAERVHLAEARAAQAFDLRDQLLGLEERRQDLYAQSSLYRQLEPRLRFAETLRILAQTLPEDSGLSDLSIAHDKKENGLLRLDFRVLCFDDTQVAEAVASLAMHPIFSDIEVQAVGPVTVGKALMREVTLEASIDLQRRFTLVNEADSP